MFSIYRVLFTISTQPGTCKAIFFAGKNIQDVLDSAKGILPKGDKVIGIPKRDNFPTTQAVYPAKFNRTELTTIAVYESYDEPVFYLAKDSVNQAYLVLALPEGWLSTPITKSALKRMEKKAITLCEAFKSAKLSFMEKDGLTTVVLTNKLPESHLPMPGTFLGV
jgi:hypothetical protein